LVTYDLYHNGICGYYESITNTTDYSPNCGYVPPPSETPTNTPSNTPSNTPPPSNTPTPTSTPIPPCTIYSITNLSPYPGSVVYTGCDGGGSQWFLEVDENASICVAATAFPPAPSDPEIDVTDTGQFCSVGGGS
jgi:hypothetical protein